MKEKTGNDIRGSPTKYPEEDILFSRWTSFAGEGNLSCKAVEESLSAAVRRQKQKIWL